MQTIDKVSKGLVILAKYGGDIAAEHDIIYAGPMDPRIVNSEDAKQLKSLGWFIDEPTDSWARFV